MKTRRCIFIVVFASLSLLGSASPFAQKPSRVTGQPSRSAGSAQTTRNATDSWAVNVKNACLVDKVTVRNENSSAMDEFELGQLVDVKEAKKSTQAKEICDRLLGAARAGLPQALWNAGDKLCRQFQKPSDGQRKPPDCKAFRGDLDADQVKRAQCECAYQGLTKTGGDPTKENTRHWKVTATCAGPDVHYVCDP